MSKDGGNLLSGAKYFMEDVEVNCLVLVNHHEIQ